MNLLLCYYALGDRDKMKHHFHRMTQLTCSTDPDDNRYYLSDVSNCLSYLYNSSYFFISYLLFFSFRRVTITSGCYWR